MPTCMGVEKTHQRWKVEHLQQRGGVHGDDEGKQAPPVWMLRCLRPCHKHNGLGDAGRNAQLRFVSN